MNTRLAATPPLFNAYTGFGAGSRLAPDFWLLGSASILILLGWIMVASASMDFSDRNHGSALFYLVRHSLYLTIALAASALVLCTTMTFWSRFAVWFLVVSFVLLAFILLPGMGYTANNATRWLALGPVTVQVSELAKVGVVLYLASYLVRQTDLVRSNIFGFINPMIVITFLITLLLAQPDFGAVVVILSASLGMLFIGGVRIWQFLALVAVSAIAVVAMVYGEEYRMARLTAFLNPWEYSQTGGYQLVQSLIAFGRGDLFGLGLGNSIQKLFFLPEAHTDFIFAVLAEELGLLGCLTVLFVYAVMIVSILRIASRAESASEHFSSYVAYGVALIFSIQLFINVGVNTGLLPTKGLTLPFISYGGSSLVVSFIFLSMVLRIDYELKANAYAQQQRKGGVVGGAARKKSAAAWSRIGKVSDDVNTSATAVVRKGRVHSV